MNGNMAKSKQKKFDRVAHLPNVTIPDLDGDLIAMASFPWYASKYGGMPIILELGCGKGEHTLAFAATHPERLCIGVDLKSHRLCVGAEKALAGGLDNVHFLRARAEGLAHFFSPRSLHEIWLTFPDPHPKQRSIKHRLTSPGFLDIYSKLMIPGGTMHLKTDSELLYDYTREMIHHWGGSVLTSSMDIHAELPGKPQIPLDELGNETKDNEGKTSAHRGSSHGPLFTAFHVESAFERMARSRGERIKYIAWTL